MDKTSLGDRMKTYERVAQGSVIRRTPVIIRLDGKAFHTWTKQLKHFDASLLKSPFSFLMNRLMRATTESLMSEIQNAVFAYSQSDEISILLNDWKTLSTDQWFNAKIQKMVSVAASIATRAFNEEVFTYNIENELVGGLSSALFDARIFNLPADEVVNYFVWREQDASRNSVNMLGQYHFSHKSLQGKNVSQVQDMLMLEKGINWNDCETWQKRGFCFLKNDEYECDLQIPIFTQDREYISRFLKPDEE